MKCFTFLTCLMLLGGCANPRVAPTPVRVAGHEVRVSSVRVVDSVSFDAAERRYSFDVSLKAREVDDMTDRFGPPLIHIDRIVGARDRVYTKPGDDGHSLTAMIAGGMPQQRRGEDSGQMNRGGLVEDDQSMPREVTVEGTLTQARVTSSHVFGLPLDMEASEVIERLSISTERGTLNNGRGRVSVRVHVDVVDESRLEPNTPIRIEIVDDDGGVLHTLDSASGRFGRGSIDRVYTSMIDDAAAGVRLHVATAIEWIETPFTIERVPVGGPVVREP